MLPTRRAILFGACGCAGGLAAGWNAPPPAGGELAGARSLIQNGALGRVAFCRISGESSAQAARALDSLMDLGPAQITQHTPARATLRYREMVASFEQKGENLVVVCGSRGTLAVDGHGWRVLSPEV